MQFLSHFSNRQMDRTNKCSIISTCVDAKDSALGLLVWEWELNFPANFGSIFLERMDSIGQIFDHCRSKYLTKSPVNSARSDQGWVKGLNPVGRHDHLE